MTARSLRRILGLQWALFATALVIGLTSIGVVAMYVLEDSFIDAHLLAAESRFDGEHVPARQVELKRLRDFPQSVRNSLQPLAPGALREFWIDPERYLHLRVLPPDAEGWRALSFEAQDELRVSTALQSAAPLLLALLALLLLLAAGLARRFGRRIESAAADLLQALDAGPSGDALRRSADAQPVAEFRRIGYALADSLDARLAALARETDLLRFLAHELRTPLQSARLAFAALPPDLKDQPARARLLRSLLRLERSSAAVLWLGEATPAAQNTAVNEVALALIQEFEPLARQRRQTLIVEATGTLWLPLPQAAIEAILSNLVLNAIQHGAAGQVLVRIGTSALQVENACDGSDVDGGFGLGLELVRRILARIGGALDLKIEEHRVCARLAVAES